jgi:hypothetical protein
MNSIYIAVGVVWSFVLLEVTETVTEIRALI